MLTAAACCKPPDPYLRVEYSVTCDGIEVDGISVSSPWHIVGEPLIWMVDGNPFDVRIRVYVAYNSYRRTLYGRIRAEMPDNCDEPLPPPVVVEEEYVWLPNIEFFSLAEDAARLEGVPLQYWELIDGNWVELGMPIVGELVERYNSDLGATQIVLKLDLILGEGSVFDMSNVRLTIAGEHPNDPGALLPGWVGNAGYCQGASGEYICEEVFEAYLY